MHIIVLQRGGRTRGRLLLMMIISFTTSLHCHAITTRRGLQQSVTATTTATLLSATGCKSGRGENLGNVLHHIIKSSSNCQNQRHYCKRIIGYDGSNNDENNNDNDSRILVIDESSTIHIDNHNHNHNHGVLSSLRGGDSNVDNDDLDINIDDIPSANNDTSHHQTATTNNNILTDDTTNINHENVQEINPKDDDDNNTKYFGLIHSVFQMNMDAKDELVNDSDDINENEDDDDDGNDDDDDDDGNDDDDEKMELDNDNDDDDDDDDEEIEDEELESKESESEIEIASDNDLINNDDDEKDQMELNEQTIDMDQVSTTTSPQLIIIDSDNEEEVDSVEEEQLEEDNDEEKEKDTSSGSESNDTDEVPDINPITRDESQSETNEEKQYLRQGDDVVDGRVSIEEEPEELPSIHDIVKEEWDMIPDTEGEEYESDDVELKEREKQEARRIERERIKNLQEEEKEQRKKDKARRREKREKRRKEREMKRQNKKLQELNNGKSNEEEGRKDDSNIEQTSVGVNTSIKQENVITMSPPSFVSSGWWATIDKVSSFGMAESNENLRLSKRLYQLRKKAAHVTGLHGIISGKGRGDYIGLYGTDGNRLNDEELGKVRVRLAAIELARKKVAASEMQAERQVPRWRRTFGRRRDAGDNNIQQQSTQQEQSQATRNIDDVSKLNIEAQPDAQDKETMDKLRAEELKRAKRVGEIDLLIKEGKDRILELQCQKDDLQRSPNPLYNYTSIDESSTSENPEEVSFAGARIFNFPSTDLVSEYIDDLQSNGRLLKMNHTQLWRSDTESNNNNEEDIGDDLLTPSGDVHKLYENDNKTRKNNMNHKRNGSSNLGGGSWILRQSLGFGGSLGEKIGAAIEDAAYKGVAAVVMSILAKSLASLHGVNVMKHSDIRLFVESTADLPPVSKAIYSSSGTDYARDAIGKAIKRGSKKKRKKKHKHYHYGSYLSDDSFIQRDAVVETLISHCQISAPLLKLFPAEWQRALLGNIIALTAAVISDFCDGVQFQILGHQLSFSFKAITEADMIQHIGVGGFRFNHRRAKPEEFEAAVRATADDVSKSLTFLDRWHQRALGGDLLKAQLGDLIARLVLTLVDEVLHSARMDLWSSQVGGPRIVAGLEYRIEDE